MAKMLLEKPNKKERTSPKQSHKSNHIYTVQQKRKSLAPASRIANSKICKNGTQEKHTHTGYKTGWEGGH